MDIGIPIVFPDYLIAVNTPPVKINVPDMPFIDIPGVPDSIDIPATKNKVEDLGHAGVLFVKGDTGLSKYYEYGRYDAAAIGLTRRIRIRDAKVDGQGISLASLKTVLSDISAKSGQGGRIMGAYIEVPGGFDKMLDYATKRAKANSAATREPYALLTNSCLHFMRDTLVAGGADMPMVIDPRPSGYIERVRGYFPDLDLTAGGKTLTIEGKGSF